MVNKELNIPFIFNYLIINIIIRFINNEIIIINNINYIIILNININLNLIFINNYN